MQRSGKRLWGLGCWVADEGNEQVWGWSALVLTQGCRQTTTNKQGSGLTPSPASARFGYRKADSHHLVLGRIPRGQTDLFKSGTNSNIGTSRVQFVRGFSSHRGAEGNEYPIYLPPRYPSKAPGGGRRRQRRAAAFPAPFSAPSPRPPPPPRSPPAFTGLERTAGAGSLLDHGG